MGIGNALLAFWVILNALFYDVSAYRDCDNANELKITIKGCSEIIEQKGYGLTAKAHAFSIRGIAYSEQGSNDLASADFDSAIAGLDEILSRTPHDMDALLSRGRAHRAKGDLRRGLADYDEAIRLDPRNVDAFNSRCWARALLGIELEIARADCDTAVKLSSNEPIILDSRGMVGIKQGKFAEAGIDYDAALRAEPGIARYYYGRGIAALRLGRTDEGNADLAEATKLEAQIAERYARFGVIP